MQVVEGQESSVEVNENNRKGGKTPQCIQSEDAPPRRPLIEPLFNRSDQVFPLYIPSRL